VSVEEKRVGNKISKTKGINGGTQGETEDTLTLHGSVEPLYETDYTGSSLSFRSILPDRLPPEIRSFPNRTNGWIEKEREKMRGSPKGRKAVRRDSPIRKTHLPSTKPSVCKTSDVEGKTGTDD
jgi:hypothetical protein